MLESGSFFTCIMKIIWGTRKDKNLSIMTCIRLRLLSHTAPRRLEKEKVLVRPGASYVLILVKFGAGESLKAIQSIRK